MFRVRCDKVVVVGYVLEVFIDRSFNFFIFRNRCSFFYFVKAIR